jgi:hypothetical protein
MNNTDLPPIPGVNEYGYQVCNTVRLYLAILDDLSPEQVNLLFKHVSNCSACTEEFQFLNSATHLVAGLSTSMPSPRVDSAVMALQSPRIGNRLRKLVHLAPPQGRSTWLISQLAVAAVLLLAFLTATHFISHAPGGPKTFELPTNLSWSNYVLFHSESRTGANGMLYRVDTYHDLGSNHMHIETTALGQFDVVVVGDEHAMLGEDMLHHIAQWGAEAWSVDDSLFDLAQLRHNLQTEVAVYLDRESFRGQDVYRIRSKGGLVLLLDMNYLPVNVLYGTANSSSGEPMYDALKLLPTSEIPSSMWDMSIPAGFQMGTLPARP